MGETKIKEPGKIKSKEELAKEFVMEYKKLCDKYGFIINVVPAFRPRDDGTWSIILQSKVGIKQ